MKKPIYRKEKYGDEYYCIMDTDKMMVIIMKPLWCQVLVTADMMSIEKAQDEALTEECSAIQFWSRKGLIDLEVEKNQKAMHIL